MKKEKIIKIPASVQLEAELKRIRHKHRYKRVIKSTLYTFITVAAVAVLVATLWMPVLQIYGNSMTPTVIDGDIVISVKENNFQQGDVVAFYYNNKILVKRVIAKAGDWVNLKKDGTVYVNNIEIQEPYVNEKAFGDCNIELPYQVPESRIFVMGDHRSTSIDSRNTDIGCVAEEQIVGKLVYCVWPMESFGKIE